MTKRRSYGCLVLVALIISTCPNYALAWYDETHIAIAKAAGYYKWFNATGADMAKMKAGEIEAHNHYCNQARGTVVTQQTVLSQVGLYNQVDDTLSTILRFALTMLAIYLSPYITHFIVRLIKSTTFLLMES
jgi:hypothetical protein